MNRALLALLGLAGLMLVAGCTTTPSPTEQGAGVEERQVPPEIEQGVGPRPASGPGAGPGGVVETTPVPPPGSFQGHPLDDPDSLLAQRVIYFDYDSSAVRNEFQDVLAAHAAYLADHAGARLSLEGHTDERGSREYNLALGEQRADAVSQMLLLLGAFPDQLERVSYGEEQPVALGHDEQVWELNRRVELLYLSR